MKKKSNAKTDKVVADEILAMARESAGIDAKRRKGKCEVCGSEAAPNATESLCWVCRRLKVSAWRDSDLQASAPE